MSEQFLGLAIAGGGYRATLYSLGALIRLNEFGLLKKLKTITSVSGGSITTGYLAIKWNDLVFDEATDVATNFDEVIGDEIFNFCSIGIDIKSGLGGLFSFRDTIGDKVAKAYDKHLFKGSSLNMIPDTAPDFIFYGTNYQTGSSVRIQKSELYDYKIGRLLNPDISIAKAVGISSAFPPLLSPVTLKLDPDKWERTDWSVHYDNKALRSKMILTDGGLYDNLGLEAIWKDNGKYTHVFSCDAGAPLSINSKVKTNWGSQLYRMTDIMTEQQRALRRRTLIKNYQEGNYGGTFFGIQTKIDDYELNDSMCHDTKETVSLQHIRTRLNPFSEEEKSQLINWGYALTDTAIRKYANEVISEDMNKVGNWPYPEYKF